VAVVRGYVVVGLFMSGILLAALRSQAAPADWSSQPAAPAVFKIAVASLRIEVVTCSVANP
jgi:hypothetical protein